MRTGRADLADSGVSWIGKVPPRGPRSRCGPCSSASRMLTTRTSRCFPSSASSVWWRRSRAKTSTRPRRTAALPTGPPRLARCQPYEGMAGVGRHLVAPWHRLGSLHLLRSTAWRGLALPQLASSLDYLHQRVRPALSRGSASVRLRSITTSSETACLDPAYAAAGG